MFSEVDKFPRQITMLSFRTSFHYAPVKKILQFPDLSTKIYTLTQCETAGTVYEAWFVWSLGLSGKRGFNIQMIEKM